jgi:tetratricopeptide (TPR) repeat protein
MRRPFPTAPAAILISALVLGPCLAVRTFADHDMTPAGGAASPPASRITGFGPVHHPVTSKVAEAQQFFDQGLGFCFAFNHEEAIRAFRRAAELDPSLAMAHWGIAYALGPNINMPMDAATEPAALEAIRKAQSLSGGASEAERAYIDAMAKRYGEPAGENRAARDSAFALAMDAVRKRSPADLDASVIYVEAMMNLRPWNFWAPDGSPQPGTEEIIAVLEDVLRKNPQHTGANHYLIHLVEASTRPDRGLPAAERLTGLAPEAGHLEHMPAHIYGRLGQHQRSAELNVRASAVDRAYIEKHKPTGIYPHMYYNHNLHFAAYSYAEIGQYAAARPYADQVSRLSADAVEQMAMLEVFTPTTLLIDIRCRKWKDVLATPEPKASMPITRALRHFGRGLAYANTGKLKDARAEQQAMRDALTRIPESAYVGFSPASRLLVIPTAMLEGRIAEAEKRWDEAERALQTAVAAEDSIAYNEPPDWYLHARESLGGFHLRRKQWTQAEQVFRAALVKHPDSARSLFGLAEAQSGAGKKDEAQTTRAKFQTVWAKADTKLAIADL